MEAGPSLQSWTQVIQIGATTATSIAGVIITQNSTAPDTVSVTISTNGDFARLKLRVVPSEGELSLNAMKKHVVSANAGRFRECAMANEAPDRAIAQQTALPVGCNFRWAGGRLVRRMVGAYVAAVSLAASLTSHALEVMTWVPPYGIASCQATATADFGGIGVKDGLTRVGLQFWTPNGDGTIHYNTQYSGVDDSKVLWWKNWGNTNGIKILLTVDNATDAGWDWSLARSAFATNRTTFVNSLVNEVDRLGLDGVDIDFEGVGSFNGDRAAYASFINDLSVALKAKGKLLTVDSFHYIYNGPNQSWWPDWVGKVDAIHSMGYDELYEGGTSYHKYSFQQNTATQAGLSSSQLLVGLPGWMNTWGTSSGRGTDVSAHLDEARYDLAAPSGITIWDLQLSGTDWRTAAVWQKIAAMKALPADARWVKASGGSWNVLTNWNTSVVPGGMDTVADFSTVDLAASAAVTLDGPRVMGSVKFGDVSPSHDWSLNAGSGGSLTLQTTAGSPQVRVNNRTVTINAPLAGTQGFNKVGAGTLAVTSPNTYAGVTTVSEGTVNVSGDQSAASGGWAINTASTVNWQANSTIAVAGGKSITLENNTTGHTLNVAGTVNNNGALAVQASSNLNLNSGANWTQAGTILIEPYWANTGMEAKLTVKSSATFSYTGASVISLKSSTDQSSSTSTASAYLTLDGGTFITGKGFRNDAATEAGSAYLNFSNGGTLKLTADVPTLATTAGRPFNVQVGTGGGSIDTNGFAAAITQAIANISGQTGPLTKRGAGTLTLAGVNTYTGATTIEGGTLDLTGSLGATAVEVQGTAKLNAGGNMGGGVTVRSNGHLAFAVAASSGAQTARTIGGALTFDNGSILDLTASGTPAVGTYTLATASAISVVPNIVNLPAGMNGSVAVVGSSLRLTVVESYSTWIATYNVGSKSAANADADMDGIPNAVEFVLGTAPNVANPSAFPVQKAGSNFIFTFNRADASKNGGLQLYVEAGQTLQSMNQVFQIGATTATSSAGITITENGTAPDTVTVTIPANGATSMFARLRVVTN